MSDESEVPLGWGFSSGNRRRKSATEKAPVKSHRYLYELEPDELSGAVFQLFALNEFKHQLQLHTESGDAVHLWRAWRAVRAFGAPPIEALELLTPHLDRLAAAHLRSANNARTEQRERREFILYMYNGLQSAGHQKEHIYQFLATHLQTTAGAIKQTVLAMERRVNRNRR